MLMSKRKSAEPDSARTLRKIIGHVCEGTIIITLITAFFAWIWDIRDEEWTFRK